jgi:HlyD family secretion protein
MRRNLRRILVGLVLLAVAIVSVGAIVRARNGTTAKTTYETAPVTRGDVVSSVSATGVLEPLTTIEVKSNVGGRIEVMPVEVGTPLKKGQLIAEIDPTDSQTQLDQAMARSASSEAKKTQAELNLRLQKAQSRSQIAQAEESLLAAQARLAQAKRQRDVQPHLTKASIAQAEANLASAQEGLRQLEEATIPQARTSAEANLHEARANLQEAQLDQKRQHELLAKGFVPQSVVDQSNARLASAEAQVSMAQRKVDTITQELEADLREAKARIDQAKAQLRTAEANRAQDEIRRRDYEAAKAAVEEAKAQLQLAIANQDQIQVRLRDITAANADIVSNKAALHQARVNMGYTSIRAPRDAVVLQKPVEQGTVIASSRSSVGSGPTIVVLGDVSRMFIVCQVDETDIAGVELDQKCDITVDAYPNELFEGKVVRIDPQAKVEQNVTTIPVKIEIDSPDARLKPGMNATVEFITAKHENVLTVPNEAIQERDGVSSVQVMVAGKPQSKNVEVGIAGMDTTEILSGVKEGELVVTKTIEPETPAASATQGQSPFQQNFRGPRGGSRPGGGGGGRGGGGR